MSAARARPHGQGRFGRFALLAAVALWTVLGTPRPAMGQTTPTTGAPTAPPLRPAPDTHEPGHRVLLLYTEPRLTPAVVSVDQAIRSTFEARSRVPVHFYTEFLDLNMFDGAAPHRELRELLRRKYESRPLDLIVAGGGAFSIALHNRDELFSGAPIVFVAVAPSSAVDLPPEAAVTGTWLLQAWAETLDFARRLQPGTRRAVVVVGATPAERTWAEAARNQLAAHAGSIEVRHLVGLSLEKVLEEIAALPEHSVVLVGAFLRDATGRDFTTPAVISRIAAVSGVPVYTLTETAIGTGAVGGQVVSFEVHGKVAAELALRVLAGERPPPTGAGTTVPMFDDRQIKRWGIDRRLLPAGSVVRFREPSLWDLYRGYVVAGAGVLLVQSGLIAGLLVQRAQRRRAQRSLAERLRFETLLSDLSAMLSACSAAEVDREIETGLRRIVEDLAFDRAAIWTLTEAADEARLTHAWIREGVGPPPAVVQEREAPRIFSQLRQGHVVHLLLSGDPSAEPLIDGQALSRFGVRSIVLVPLIAGHSVVGGLSAGMVLEERRWPDELIPRLRLLADVFANALARRRAERAAHESAAHIRDLAGRLMTSQEEERRRIARELHDGVNQDLAALSIALSALEDGLPEGTPADRRQEVARLQGRTVEMAEAIRHLSHELHPSILQHVGLAAALRSHCREFGREHGLTVTLRADDDLGPVPADVALCLFRVTQEALGNVARYAKASQVRVALARDGTDLMLTIGDDGRGFDLAEARGRGGLGLISLDERVRLVRGHLTIDTQPQRGTQLQVVVPLSEPRDAPSLDPAR
jgi:signal transduction histidine kinase/ABC-type uncharacterized transport system substrate-binding protein